MIVTKCQKWLSSTHTGAVSIVVLQAYVIKEYNVLAGTVIDNEENFIQYLSRCCKVFHDICAMYDFSF